MRVALVAMLAVVTAARAAHADGSVGVVVTGDVGMQPEIASYLERWLKTHGHELVISPLSADATNTILNCLVLDDQKCARGVVDARSRADSLVFARVDVAKNHDVTFDLHWFAKGHEPIGERRVCEHCVEDSWHEVADTMMTALAGSGQIELGRVAIRSNPPGMRIVLDSTEIGTTPLEREVPAGKHTIELTQGGRTMALREVVVEPHKTRTVDIHANGDREGAGARIGSILLLGAGITALGAGGVFLYYGSIGGASAKYIYPDSTPFGIGLAAVGVGATIGGTILLLQSGSRSSPVATVGPGRGYVGWMTRF